MRPGDRRSQGRVALVGVARALEQIEARVEALEQRLGREELRPRGGELDGEWQMVEARAELGDVLVSSEIRAHRVRTFHEQRNRLRSCERRQIQLRLAVDAQRLATRRHQP